MATGRGKALIVLAVSVGFSLGCGARTDTLFDDGGYGAGGYGNEGNFTAGGYGNVSGSYNAGGYGNVSGYGGSLNYAGSFSTGGGYVGGSTSFGGFSEGGFHAGGTGSAGAPFGGFGAVSGSFGAGGVAGTGIGGFGGFGAVGGVGEAGAGGSGGIVQLCVGAAQTACDKCVCSTCGSQLSACFTDLGCALVFACVQETKCQGFGCYQSSTCRGVIDQFGGLTGSAVSEVFSLGSCAITSRTSCGCN